MDWRKLSSQRTLSFFSIVNRLAKGTLDRRAKRTPGNRKTVACRREVSFQNFGFLDAIIREEAVGCFGVRPVLAGIGNAFAHAVTDLPDQIGKSPPQPRIFEGGFIDLAVSPMLAAAFSAALEIAYRPQNAPRRCESGAR